MALATVRFDARQPIDLEASLLGGQAHRWKREGEWYSGVLRGEFLLIRPSSRDSHESSDPSALPRHSREGGNPEAQLRNSYPEIEFLSNSPDPQAMIARIRDHLRLDDDLKAIQAEIAGDPNVAAQVERYPGLRVLRQDPWECLIAYICSANSNIETIHRNMERLSDEFGEPLTLPHPQGEGTATITRNTFPKPVDLAEAGEAELRRLKLGFRAPYVHQAAIAVAERRLDLDHLIAAPYLESKAELMALKGIGDKIADCIALMSMEKMEAFPIDVWVRRALADWYFPGQKTPTNRILLEWAQRYFGRYAGYANQYLFHGRRLRDRKPAQPESG